MTAWMVICIAIVFVISVALTRWTIAYARRRGMWDVPGRRSSHTTPTPRGGGIAFAGVILAATVCLLCTMPGALNVGIALLGGGAAVAAVGWLDDRHNLSARVRLLIHFAAAVWAVAWLSGMPHIDLGFGPLALGGWGVPLAVCGIVWSTNLFNFMDGIDGLAASQAVVVGAAAGSIALFHGDAALAMLAWVAAASVAGFLVWNWSPAKIFMGDSGSGFLGFLLAVMALAGESRDSFPLVIGMTLMGVFFVDATATLLFRMWNREPWYRPHRSHAYQRAVVAGLSHRRVTGSVAAITGLLAGAAAVMVLLPPARLAIFAMTLSLLLVLLFWVRSWKTSAVDQPEHTLPVLPPDALDFPPQQATSAMRSDTRLGRNVRGAA